MDAFYAIGIDVILLLILGIGLGQNLSIKLLGVLLLIFYLVHVHRADNSLPLWDTSQYNISDPLGITSVVLFCIIYKQNQYILPFNNSPI